MRGSEKGRAHCHTDRTRVIGDGHKRDDHLVVDFRVSRENGETFRVSERDEFESDGNVDSTAAPEKSSVLGELAVELGPAYLTHI